MHTHFVSISWRVLSSHWNRGSSTGNAGFLPTNRVIYARVVPFSSRSTGHFEESLKKNINACVPGLFCSLERVQEGPRSMDHWLTEYYSGRLFLFGADCRNSTRFWIFLRRGVATVHSRRALLARPGVVLLFHYKQQSFTREWLNYIQLCRSSSLMDT